MAAARSKRRLQSSRERRRLAAINFLSNISLDGTHSDTKLNIFNKSIQEKRGLVNVSSAASSLQEESQGDTPVSVVIVPGSCQQLTADNVAFDPSSYQDASYLVKTPEISKNESENSHTRLGRSSTTSLSYKAGVVNVGVTPLSNVSEGSPDKRWRASSYSGDRDRVLRKKLVQLYSETGTAIHTGHTSIKATVEKVAERIRRSSSISAESSDSSNKGSREIKFVHSSRLHRHERNPFRNERIVLVSKKKVPLIICSTVPYNKASQHGLLHRSEMMTEDIPVMRVRHSSGTILRPISACTAYEDALSFGLQAIARTEEGQDVSYSEFLVPSQYQHIVRHSHSQEFSLPISESSFGYQVLVHRSYSHDPTLAQRLNTTPPILEKVPEEEDSVYDPNLLDDPELRSGSYRTLMTFPSYITSVIDYVKPSELKKEVNEKFRLKFPQIQLTLSKLRSLKREMKQIGCKCGGDLWAVAQSYVYFEKLILKLLINKQNRKLCAGACLMLSAKLNDVKRTELAKLIEHMEDDLRVQRKELAVYEMAVLVALEFSLHISDQEIYPHYQRLLYDS